MQLHATQKLAAKLTLDQQGVLPSTPRSQWLFEIPDHSSGPLGSWQGHLFTLQRRNCALLVHEQTRFPVFMPNLCKLDFQEFNDRFLDCFMNTLLKCGADHNTLEAAHCALRPFQVDTQCDRSTMGTLNRMRLDIEDMLHHEDVNVCDITGYRVGAWLSDRPCSTKSRGFLWPRKEMLQLLQTLPALRPGPARGTASLPDNVVSLAGYRQRNE